MALGIGCCLCCVLVIILLIFLASIARLRDATVGDFMVRFDSLCDENNLELSLWGVVKNPAALSVRLNDVKMRIYDQEVGGNLVRFASASAA